MELVVQPRLRRIGQFEQGQPFRGRGVEPVADMVAGKDEQVAGAGRIAVADHHGQRILQQHPGRRAERAVRAHALPPTAATILRVDSPGLAVRVSRAANARSRSSRLIST